MNIVITGGAGFLGTNIALALRKHRHAVTSIDDYSRSTANTYALRTANVLLTKANIMDAQPSWFADVDAVIHCAAQTAVTTSLDDPVDDFAINAYGTLCLLEALRACDTPPPFLFFSTNKVYGSLPEIVCDETATRYVPRQEKHRSIDELQPLNFATPYGCSKGAADQYVCDYRHTFGLPTTVFRASCMYGPRQHATTDQGWVAHFIKSALAKKPLTIYGSGKQVRDVLYVDDVTALVRRWLSRSRRSDAHGVFNIGGGLNHTLSVNELVQHLVRLDHPPDITHADERPSDQPYYVSNLAKASLVFDWQPTVTAEEGIKRTIAWLSP